MPVFKNEGNGTWYVMARYVNWKGERKQKCKRGFACYSLVYLNQNPFFFFKLNKIQDASI